MSRRLLQGTKSILKYFLTPLLFSVYPVIFLYTHNIEMLTIGQLTAPLLLTLLLASLTFIVARLILKENIKASLATVGFVILFWNYSLFFSGITYFLNLNHWHILPLLLFIYGHFVYLICVLYKRFNLDNLHKVVFAVASVLIIFNLLILIPGEVNKYQITSQKEIKQEMSKKGADSGNYPDIYLIILDEYASLDTIKEEWGYDNSIFAQFLKDKGFYVVEKGEHRYFNTTESISSLLNLKYITGSVEKSTLLDFVYERDKVRNHEKYDMLSEHSPSDLFEMIGNNFLINFLKQHDYEIVVLEGISQHFKALNFRYADSVFSYQDINGSEKLSFVSDSFFMELIRKSLILPFDFGKMIFSTNYRSYIATKYVFNFLQKNKKSYYSPKFIYAHIECPHNPYVFNREGHFVTNVPYNNADFKRDPYVHPNKSVNPAYLEQYIYVNNELEKTINIFFENGNPTDKIIVIQNDHGPRPHELYLKDRTQPFKAFNAVYFPDGDYTDLYENIAPINTLRVVLNKHLGETFEMLEDK